MSKDLSDYLANDTLVFVDTQGAATPAHFENKKKGCYTLHDQAAPLTLWCSQRR